MVAEKPTEPLVVLCCRGCGSPLGVCTDRQLHLGALVVRARVAFACQRCGRVSDWRPRGETMPPG